MRANRIVTIARDLYLHRARHRNRRRHRSIVSNQPYRDAVNTRSQCIQIIDSESVHRSTIVSRYRNYHCITPAHHTRRHTYISRNRFHKYIPVLRLKAQLVLHFHAFHTAKVFIIF